MPQRNPYYAKNRLKKQVFQDPISQGIKAVGDKMASMKAALTPKANPNGIGKNLGPIYTEPGLVSVGGKIGSVGGTIGIDRKTPFASINIKGKPVAAIGPGDSDLVDNGGKKQKDMMYKKRKGFNYMKGTR